MAIVTAIRNMRKVIGDCAPKFALQAFVPKESSSYPKDTKSSMM
jgi:hypothetical protein